MNEKQMVGFYWYTIDQLFNRANVAIAGEVCREDYFTSWNGSSGLENLKSVVLSLKKAFPDLHYDIQECWAQGDLVFASLHMCGTDLGGFGGRPPSGRRMDTRELHIIRMGEDGRFIEGWPAFDALQVAQQLWGPQPKK